MNSALGIKTITPIPEEKQKFEREGYFVAKGLFSSGDVEAIKKLFEDLRLGGNLMKDIAFQATEQDDPLVKYQRIMHPHRTNALAMKYFLHSPVWDQLESLFGREPWGAQSMYYFKPPGARGQALHQDQFYLMVDPGTCIAAWTAIDDCDEENGAMYVVPHTNNTDVICPEKADRTISFTTHFVPIPKGKKAQIVKMKAGDTLFFNGNLIHGSGPNRSKSRFRRSLICHYVAGNTDKISEYFQPLIKRDGTAVNITANTGGGPCGEEWGGGAH